MTFPKIVFLLTALTLSPCAIGLELRESSLINYKTVAEGIYQRSRSSGVSGKSGYIEADSFVDTVDIFGGKSKSEVSFSEIHKYASLSAESGDFSITVSVIENGLRAAIDLVAASSDVADKCFARAKQISYNNPESAIKVIQKGMQKAQQLINNASLPIYYSFNAAGLLNGDGSQKLIKLALESLQLGGAYAIASLAAAETLSINGLKSNLAAASKGIDAAQETALTGYEAAFASLVLAGKSTFKAVSDDISSFSNNKESTKICKTRTTTLSAEAKAAENEIRFRAARALKSISPGPVANAIFKIEQALICGIEAAAGGEASALTAISVASKLAINQPDIALATLRAGISILQMEILNAGNETCQGLEEASIILGNWKINEIVASMVQVQNGLNSALVEIETVEKHASFGLKFGGEVAKQGLIAVHKSVLAVVFVFYSILVRIGEEAF